LDTLGRGEEAERPAAKGYRARVALSPRWRRSAENIRTVIVEAMKCAFG